MFHTNSSLCDAYTVMTKTVPKIIAVHYCLDLQDLLICSGNESEPPKWRVKICYHNIHNQATSDLARPRISFLATKNYRHVFERSQTSVTFLKKMDASADVSLSTLTGISCQVPTC